MYTSADGIPVMTMLDIPAPHMCKHTHSGENSVNTALC